MNVLSIAGSDPSSGAGIQGDVKTFASLGVHGFTVITALTNQNTSEFFEVYPINPSVVKAQLRSIFLDFKVDAIKIGMVYDSKIIKIIYHELKHKSVPIILDPIFESTTGGKLLRDNAFVDFKKFLMPLAYVITPNMPEAERITNSQIRELDDLKVVALKIKKMGPKNVVIKGGHLKSLEVTDILLENRQIYTFSQKRIKKENHGGGCVFSAALCVAVAKGKPLIEGVRFAQETSFRAIRDSTKIGKGLSIVAPKTGDLLEKELIFAINEFTTIDDVYKYIPECQTNFVYSKSRPQTTFDILGLEGRIVRTGTSATVAGELKYGGSKHVASAVLEIARMYPSVRSALNIKFDDKIIEKAIAKKFHVSYYDRREESHKNKKKEGTTISWGIRAAISDTKIPPDIIYHKGGIEKEPMILIFGKTPTQVLAKLVKIRR
jgi:hydroxymethylpyrimidine kinase / phosphomethylpyrimidine kinase / thiamine-phosphate diphosphorylase